MKLKKRNKVNAAFSMASLTDIIFLLLIFFVINSEMPNALKLLLPNANGKTTANQSISLSVSSDLQYMIDNEAVEFVELEQKLHQKINADNSSDETTVVLNIDKRVELEKVVEVLEIGNNLQVPMILSTKPKK